MPDISNCVSELPVDDADVLLIDDRVKRGSVVSGGSDGIDVLLHDRDVEVNMYTRYISNLNRYEPPSSNDPNLNSFKPANSIEGKNHKQHELKKPYKRMHISTRNRIPERVANISDLTLTHVETSLLKKGFSFIPSPRSLHSSSIYPRGNYGYT